VRPLLREACRDVRAPRLLDCGCGTGNNLKLLGEFGRAFGFDLTASGLEFARLAGARGIVRASVLALPFHDRAFDVATSFDVLYCLDDRAETAALDEMRRILAPGGALLVNVAALDALRGHHSILGGEVRRYTRRRLRRSIEGAGFSIVRLTYTNLSILPLVTAVRLVQRLHPPASSDALSSDITVPLAPVNAGLSALLAVEAAALRVVDMPIGSSLLCLARKK
jgi:SAM-dependent methyltransferase